MLMQEQMLGSYDGLKSQDLEWHSLNLQQSRRWQPNSNRTSIKELKAGAIFTESNIHVQD